MSFIWVEAVGCGEILPPFIESYLAHHKEAIHVVGYKEDLVNLPQDSRIVKIEISETRSGTSGEASGLNREEIAAAYQYGHKGTATIWAYLIATRPEQNFIHLDADTIFLDNVLDEIEGKLTQGYSVVGTRRPYRYQKGKSSKRARINFFFSRDCVNTHCFGFKKSDLLGNQELLRKMIEGRGFNPIHTRLFPVIDFFDRITFRLARKGSIYYLDSENQGRHGRHDRFGKTERRMISFAAVGSGSAFYKNSKAVISASYRELAIGSYALFSKYLLNKEIDFPILDSPYLINHLEKLDQSTWTLRELGEVS